MKRFGLFYGIAFSGYAFGAVSGAVAVGRYFDLRHNYGLPLQVAPLLPLAAGVLLLSLGSCVKPGIPQGVDTCRYTPDGSDRLQRRRKMTVGS